MDAAGAEFAEVGEDGARERLAVIDAAFLSNENPWKGAAGEYEQLFSKIVNIAPAPVGLGPS